MDDRQPTAWQHVRYRVGQFWQGLWAHVTPEERAEVATLLDPPATELFRRMPVDAQRHSLNVLAAVRTADDDSIALQQAALLHDVGKCAAAEAGVGFTLWVRGPLVLLNAFLPALVEAWAADDQTRPWRYLLYVYHAHPTIGARWAAEAGCSELCCWLIAHHQTPLDSLPSSTPEDGRRALLATLQAADAGD